MTQWWGVAVPPDADVFELPRSGAVRRALAKRLRWRAPGSVVALRASESWSWLRTRAFLERAGLRVEREYLVFPGFTGPGFLIESRGDAFRHFFSSVLFMPSGGYLRLIAVAVLARIASSAAGWRLAAAATPARLVIARRT